MTQTDIRLEYCKSYGLDLDTVNNIAEYPNNNSCNYIQWLELQIALLSFEMELRTIGTPLGVYRGSLFEKK